MAQYLDRITLLSPPYQINLPYYSNGIDLGGDNMALALDPVDTSLYYIYESERDSSIPPDTFFNFVISLSYSAIQDGTNLDRFATIDGDYIEIRGQRFNIKSTPLLNNEIQNCDTTPLQQKLTIIQLCAAINSNAYLSSLYYATVVDLTLSPYSYTATGGGAVFAIKITAKYKGPLNNITVYDNTLQPLGDLKFNFSNSPTWATYDGTFNRVYNTNAQYMLSVDTNKGQKLEGNNYGVFLEIWILDEQYQAVQWGRRNNSFTGRKIATLTQDWNSSNKFVFEVSNYLRPYIKLPYPSIYQTPTQFLTPTLYHDFIFYKEYPILPYYVVVGEYFNGGLNYPLYISSNGLEYESKQLGTDKQIVTDSYSKKYYIVKTELTRWACRGAFPQNIIPADNVRYWGAKSQGPGRSILTNQYFTQYWSVTNPKNKLIRRNNVPEYLWAYIQNDEYINDYREYRVRFTLWDNSGSITLKYTPSNIIQNSGLIVVDINPYNIGGIDLVAYETSGFRLNRFEATLEWSIDGTNFSDYTNAATYIMDLNNEYDNTEYYNTNNVNTTFKRIYWRNSLGTFESFDFEFVETMEYKVDNLFYNRIEANFVDPEYKRDKAVINKLEAKTELFTNVNSGFVNREHYIWLQGLLASTEVYTHNKELVDTQTDPNFPPATYIPRDLVLPESIIITDYEWSLNEIDDSFNLKVKYKPAFYNNNIKT